MLFTVILFLFVQVLKNLKLDLKYPVDNLVWQKPSIHVLGI